MEQEGKMKFITLLIAFTASFAHPHGGDKPGPNNGYIKMPGGFHTEVVPFEKGFRIYLLDADFKAPTTEESSVKVSLKQKDKFETGNCLAKIDHFECTFSTKNLSSGQIDVLAIRKKAPGNSVTYALPLQFEKHH